MRKRCQYTCAEHSPLTEAKKISKLLNASRWRVKDKRPASPRRFSRVRRESTAGRTGRGRGEGRRRAGREEVASEDDENREKLVLPCAYARRVHIYRRAHFRASDPRIGERRLFASRHLVANFSLASPPVALTLPGYPPSARTSRLVYLLIYFSVAPSRVYRRTPTATREVCL